MNDKINKFLEFELFKKPDNFKDLSKKILNKDLIKITKKIISKILNENISLNDTKIFLKIFLVYNFEKEFFKNKKSTCHQYLFQNNTKKIYNIFKKIIYKYNSKEIIDDYKKMFTLNFFDYLRYYNELIYEERFDILNEYIYLYNQCESNITYLKKKIYKDYVEDRIECLRYFKNYITKKGKIICPEFKEYVIEFTVKAKKIIYSKSLTKSSKIIYFEEMEKDISNKKPKKLEKFLKRIKKRLIKLYNPANKDEIEKINNNFDVSFLVELIIEDDFNIDDFKEWAKFIFFNIKALHSPTDDTKHDDWTKKFNEEITDEDFLTYLMKFFRYINDKIELIEDDLDSTLYQPVV